MHKDQRRIQGALLPRILDAVLDSDPKSERDCTVLNRLFLQGPDPLFLMETCPEDFNVLCARIGMDVSMGRKAIEDAHWRGPGILLDGRGMPSDIADLMVEEPLTAILPGWHGEILWLYLAALSDTTEQDYAAEITLLERIQRATRACQKFALLHDSSHDYIHFVATKLKQFEESCVWTMDENGIPVCDEDVGFYIGYKRGWRICGVRHGDKVFYGTTPDTTLAEQGVKVDVNVSESYGFIRVSA